jgi:hypothetical protein
MFHVRLPALAFASVSLLSISFAPAATVLEDFATDPAMRGWGTVGDASLLSWNSANQNLEVTWDSSQSNSFYCLPLGTVLAATDEFAFAFDLRLSDLTAGYDPAKPYSFELAIGLINLAQASATNFLRGSGSGTPNLLEFDYFPDDGSGFFSLDATMSDTNAQMQFFYANVALGIGDTYRISIHHGAGNSTVESVVTQNGAPFCELTNAFPSSSFSDFRLDHFAVCSYSDAGQDPLFSGSVYAHGVVDNVSLTLPPPPVSIVIGGPTAAGWQVTCLSQTNWLYALERTVDLQIWSVVSPAVAGTGTTLALADPNPPNGSAMYRIKAARP